MAVPLASDAEPEPRSEPTGWVVFTDVMPL